MTTDYPPLPVPFCVVGGMDTFNIKQMREFVDLDRKARATAEPTNKQILANADRLFPRWREDIQERFVLQNARAALALRAPAASVAPEPTADTRRIDWLESTQQQGHYCGVFGGSRITRESIDALSGVAQAKDSNVRTDRTVVAGSGSSHSGAAAVASSGRVEQAKDGT